MSKLKIEKDNALKAYQSADEKGKKLLEDLFPVLFHKLMPIMERVKTWEDILEISGETLTIPNPVTDRQVALNTMDMMLIARDVISEGWEADYSNKQQRKWELVYQWDDSISGFGFLYSCTDFWYAHTYVGARLVFETKEKAQFFAKIMMPYINNFLIKNHNKTNHEN